MDAVVCSEAFVSGIFMNVVFIHGFTGSPQSGQPLRMHLGNAVRSWDAPAVLGHGASHPWSNDFEQEVHRLTAHLKDKTVLIGYSMGARLALQMALQSPERVARLLLISVNPGLENDAAKEARCFQDEKLAVRIERDGTPSFVEEWQSLPLFGEADLPASKRDRRRQIRLSHSPAGLSESLRILGLGAMPNAWPLLSELRMPLDLMAGAEDPKFVDVAKRVKSRVPSARLRLMAGSAHDALLHDPKQISDWLLQGLAMNNRESHTRLP